MFRDGHFEVEGFFSRLPSTHTGIMLADGHWCTRGVPPHAWLRCCIWWCIDRSLTAQELGKATDRVGTKTFLVCAITPCATGLKTLGKFLQLFSLPLLNVNENITSTAGDRKSWLWQIAIDRTLLDSSSLLPRVFVCFCALLDSMIRDLLNLCMKLPYTPISQV